MNTQPNTQPVKKLALTKQSVRVLTPPPGLQPGASQPRIAERVGWEFPTFDC